MSRNAFEQQAYVPSPISYYDQSHVPLIIDSDPLCSPNISLLFVNFAGDYFYSQNVSQIPEYPGSDSPWAEFVRVFSDQPAAVKFVRNLSRLFREATLPTDALTTANLNHPTLSAPNLQPPSMNPPNINSPPSLAAPSQLLAELDGKPGSLQLHTQPPKNAVLDAEPGGPVQEDEAVSNQNDFVQKDFIPKGSFFKPEPELRPPELRPSDLRPDLRPPGLPPGLRPPDMSSPTGTLQSYSTVRKTGDRSCENPTCSTEAGYNYKGLIKRRFCRKHCLEGMVSVVKFKKCEIPGCEKMPLYGFEGTNHRKYCTIHRVEGMISLKGKKCIEPGCMTRANCNYPGETKRLYCGKHKHEGMMNLNASLCAHPGCKTEAQFDFQGSKKGKYCSKHKLKGMLQKGRTFCEVPQCSKVGSYNFDGQKKGRFCTDHKLKGMVSVYFQTCKAEGCFSPASCNYEGLKKREYCSTHKLKGMVPVYAQKPKPCQFPGCKGSGTYKDKIDKKLRLCIRHKQPDMLLTTMPFCQYDNCKKLAVCNYPGVKGKKFCTLHAVDGMIEIKKPKQQQKQAVCENQECTKYAWYNYEGETKPRFCKDHLLKGMIPLNRKICEERTCLEVAYYNFPGQKERYCAAHRFDGMERVKRVSKRVCKMEGCDVSASFNYEGARGVMYCDLHHLEGMVNVVKAKHECKHPGCAGLAIFNHPGESEQVFCQDHKVEGMKAMHPPGMCEVPECFEPARYAFVHDATGPKVCDHHRLEGMVERVTRLAPARKLRKKRMKRRVKAVTSNVAAASSERCEVWGCMGAPLFNYGKFGKGRLCENHRMTGMIDVSLVKKESSSLNV